MNKVNEWLCLFNNINVLFFSSTRFSLLRKQILGEEKVCSWHFKSLIFLMWLLLINFLPDTFCKEPFCLWKFCWKMRFEASRAVFWSLSCYKELKLTIKPFTGCTLCDLLIQMQNITCSLRSSDMRRKQNFTFSPPLFFRFSCLICSFCWAFSRLHIGGKSF